MSTTNTLKTGLLLAALTGLLAVAGQLFGGTTGLVIALLLAVAMNGATYWFSDRLALAMAHARPVSRSDAPLLPHTGPGGDSTVQPRQRGVLGPEAGGGR